MLTTDTCFDSPTFCQWWDAVDDASGNHCWDDGIMLEILVDLFNNGCPVPDAAAEAVEAWEIGQAEAAMGVPSWA